MKQNTDKKVKSCFALVVKAIIYKDNKFLLLHRSKEEIAKSYPNNIQAWDLPGGGLRFSETTTEGLYREIFEETGLKVKIENIFSCYDVIKGDLHLTIVTYVCRFEYGEVLLSREHDNFYWITANEAENMNIPKWMLRDFKKVYTQKNKCDNIK